MNFSKALELLKQGKKVRKRCWANSQKLYLDLENHEFWVATGTITGTIGIRYDDMLADDWEEYKEPLLTEEEKEYLRMIIKFNLFKVKTVEITRPDLSFDERHFLLLKGYNDDEVDSANFIKPNYFKNLENTKPYTLKELGLNE